MDDVTLRILEVQDRDLRIAKLQKMIDSVPVEKEKTRNELQGAEDLVAARKHELQHVQSRINDLDSKVQTHKARIIDLQNKSTQVKKNDEYRGIMNEIATNREKISGVEDQQLELMEEVEQARDRLAQADKDLEAAKIRMEAARKDLDIRQENCAEQIKKIKLERDELARDVPDTMMHLYSRLTAQPTAQGQFRKAVVPVENGHCGYCHLKIPPDLQIKARSKNDTTCGNCGSILYWPG